MSTQKARRQVIAGNWKLHNTLSQSSDTTAQSGCHTHLAGGR